MKPAELEERIPQIVERLRRFDPVQVVLFGSHARGDAGEHSDLDLLVVLRKVDGDRFERQAEMRSALRDLRLSFHVWASDGDEVGRTADSVGSFLYPVVREGRVIYGVDERNAETWLRFAEDDLRASERMNDERGWAPRIACFHAQQAAEKALKAVRVADGFAPIFTHSLALLRDALGSDRRARLVEGDLDWLSEWATLPRYPSDRPDATAEDARRALDLARRLVEAARRDVRGEG